MAEIEQQVSKSRRNILKLQWGHSTRPDLVVGKPGGQDVTVHEAVVGGSKPDKTSDENIKLRAGKIRAKIRRSFITELCAEIDPELVAAFLELRVTEIAGFKGSQATAKAGNADGQKFAERGKVIEPLPSR